MIKRLYLFIFILMLVVLNNKLNAQTATDGDYRSAATGTWGTAATWQVRTAGSWAAASVAPTSTNNVYIQSGHTVTLGANADCNDLHSHTAGVLALTTKTINVNGKIRAYTGTAVTATGADGTFYSGQTSTTTPVVGQITFGVGGLLKFVGGTRNITNTGEWGSFTTQLIVEFALNTGATGTLVAGTKAASFLFSSGTVDWGSNRIAADNGSANSGTLTINAGAKVISSASNFCSRTASTAMGTFIVNGTLELSNAAPACYINTFTCNGTVSYTKSGIQTLLALTGGTGTGLGTYTNLTLSGTSLKTSPASQAVVVNGTLSIQGTSTFVLGSLSTLTYGTGATLDYSTTNSISSGPEFLAAIPNLTVNGTGALTLQGPSTLGTFTSAAGSNVTYQPVAGAIAHSTLTISGTTLINGAFTHGKIVNGANTWYGMVQANGNVTISGSGASVTMASSNINFAGTGTKTFTLSNGATLNTAKPDATNFFTASVASFGTYVIDNTNGSGGASNTTITLKNGGGGTIMSPPNSQQYGNLVIQSTTGGTGDMTTKIGQNLTITGNLTVLYQSTGIGNEILNFDGKTITGSSATLAANATGQGSVKFQTTGGTAVTNLSDFLSGFTTATFTNTPVTTAYSMTIPGGTYNNITTSNGGSGTGFTLNADATVSGILTLTSSVIATGSNTIIISNTAAGAVTRTSGWVNGNLKRAHSTSTGSFLFPVGSSANYRGATVNFTGAPANATNLTSKFTESDPGNLGIPSGMVSCWNGGYWTIASDGTPNGTYSLSLDVTGVSGLDASTRILKRPDNTSAWVLGGTFSDLTSNVLTHSGITSFSEFTLGGDNSLLPVELTSFTSNITGGKVVLNWNTATEINNSFFSVERSKQGVLKKWLEVGKVLGSGNSSSPKSYAFTDSKLNESGVYVYRLIQHDNDGTKKELKSIEVNATLLPTVYVLDQNYPNPFNPSTEIRYGIPEDARVMISIYSITGSLIKTVLDEFQSAGFHTVNYDAGTLSSGTYIYQMTAGTFKQTKKLVILK